MLTKDKILEKLEKNKDKIKSLGVKKLILFGSYAKNTATAKSDIDVLVRFEKGRGLFEDFVHLLDLLEKMFHKKIDLVKPHLVRKELKKEILRGKQIEAKI